MPVFHMHSDNSQVGFESCAISLRSEPLHADYKIGTSDFYRQLKLKPESDDVCNTALNPCTENRLNVISRVQWKENDATREVVLETYLYDFYGRNSY